MPLQTAPLVRSSPRVRDSTNGFGTWFGAISFAAESIGTFGNVHRNPYHGPGINNTNVVVAKNLMLMPERGVSMKFSHGER